MASGTITKRAVDSFTAGRVNTFLWDEEVPGFGVKATPAGSKVYLLQYRLGGRGNPTRRYTIGKHGPWTPDQARKRAKELLRMVEQGIDPRQAEDDAKAAALEARRLAERQAKLESELLFEKVAERWLAHYETEKGRRPGTVAQARHIVKKRLEPALKGKPLPHITRADLQAIIDAIPASQKASRLAAYAYASVLFRWAMERGDIDDNPIRLVAKPSAPKSRERVLSDDELAQVWKSAQTLREPYGAFYRLLILTGQRRDEVASMAWHELDRESAIWTIPADRAKNDKVQIVPLAPTVVAELDRMALAAQVAADVDHADATQWPKSGPLLSTDGKKPIRSYSKAKAELDEAISLARKESTPLPKWRVHDFRRTLATGLQRLGVRFEVTEAVINHVSGARSGVAGIYQRHDWAEEKRSALEAWARHVESVATGKTSTVNVIPISPSARRVG